MAMIKEKIVKLNAVPRQMAEDMYDRFSHGRFNRFALGEIYLETTQEIQALLSLEACNAYRDPKGLSVSQSTKVTARDYLMHKFSLKNLDAINKSPTVDSLRLLQLFAYVETALLRHLVNTPNVKKLSSATQYKLRLTGASSDSFAKGNPLQPKSHCLFSMSEFDAELAASGVRPTAKLLEGKDEIYKRFTTLPPAVKTLFFSQDSDTPIAEPYAMVKDLLEFADENTWHMLCEQANQDSKATFNQFLNSFVDKFIQSEKARFQLKLGVIATKTNADGVVVKASNKAQAIAQFCKPRKWIAKAS